MPDTHEIRDLLERANELEHSPEQVALLEEAVRLADAARDEALAYEARFELIDAATFSGESEKAMTAFAWCLAHFDRQAGAEWPAELYWKYKWILNGARGFPQIPLERVEALHADFERRVREAGFGPRTAPYFRMRLALHRGDLEEARRRYAAWQFSPRDFLSDCAACETNAAIDYQIAQGRDEKALEAAAPILSGRQSCAHVPHTTYAKLLAPLLRLGEAERARELHERGYALVRDDDVFLPTQAAHLGYLARAGELDEAARLYERHVGRSLRAPDAEDRFAFGSHALGWLDRVAARGVATLRLSLPGHHPLRNPSGEYAVAALRDWHEATARDIADRFDRRNGTDAFARRLAQRRGAV